MKRLYCLLAIQLLVTISFVHAQEKLNIKFGRMDPKDFEIEKSKLTEGMDAVYLADIGTSSFNGNTKGGFTLEFKRKVRIKVLTNNGFDAADFSIPVYQDNGMEERVVNLKGTTYNMENGKIVEMSLKNDQIFINKINKKLSYKKFTLPGVKVGSVIDVEYTILSDYYRNLQPWDFQNEYPVLWSEYEVVIPEFFNYLTVTQGNGKFHVDKRSEAMQSFTVIDGTTSSQSDVYSLSARVYGHRWVMKDVPALKEEPFVSTLRNHCMNVHFQLNRIQFSQQAVPSYQMGTWSKLAESLNKSEYFGAWLPERNAWMDDEVALAKGSAKEKLETAKNIYRHIRDNYTCIGRNEIYSDNEGVKGVIKAKKGTQADLNLLLVGMLKHEGLEAYPVILSTKEHGLVQEQYPVLDKFNATIAALLIDSSEYFLDASEPLLGFGRLKSNYYNGFAFLVNGMGLPIHLSPGEINERKITTLSFLEEAGDWYAKKESSIGYYESLGLRDVEKSDGKEAIVKKIQTSLGDFKVTDTEIKNIDNKDDNLSVSYKVHLNKDDEDILYLNPLLGEEQKENPFKSAERLYPVEMPYTIDEMIIANIDIPQGYVIDEIPKSVRFKLNENEGMFEYLIQAGPQRIQMRVRVLLNRTVYTPDDYQTLREFFDAIVNKESEQIVFKKKATALN